MVVLGVVFFVGSLFEGLGFFFFFFFFFDNKILLVVVNKDWAKGHE